MLQSIIIIRDQYDGYRFVWWDHVLTRDCVIFSYGTTKPTWLLYCLLGANLDTTFYQQQEISHLRTRENGRLVLMEKCVVQTDWFTGCSYWLENQVDRVKMLKC